jgi:glycosyltransferase involved in cell wall biosynthesis
MAENLWRKIARRVRRGFFSLFEAEIHSFVEPKISRLREDLSRDRNAWIRRFDKLEPLLLEHPEVLSTSRRENPIASPAVTIVMPTWNRSHLVGAAIRSVQAQEFPHWELIVVDDGSTDDTNDIVAAFAPDARIRYLKQSHGGQCAARNHALRHANGALIAYLDSDNLWYPGFLAAAVRVFSAQPTVDCLYGAMITESHLPGERILFEPFDRNRLLARNYIGMSTFIHRRRLIDQFGGFDEELVALEDWDLILRYTAHAPAYRLPVLAARYRTLDEKRVTITARMDEADARIRSKWKQV